jgi:hypothetical protein
MRKALWVALSVSPFATLAAAALYVGVLLAARDPANPVEGKGIYAGFLFLSLALALASLITAGIAASRWWRSMRTDPAAARFYRNVAIVSAPAIVLVPAYGPYWGLGLAYAIAKVA